MTIARSIVLFALAALFEIGGAWLIWQGWREHKGLWWIAAGVIALGAYGFVATFQEDPNFGRILAAYGGVFVAGSLGWGMIVDKFRPDRYDIIGAAIYFIGVAVIMYARPQPNSPFAPVSNPGCQHRPQWSVEPARAESHVDLIGPVDPAAPGQSRCGSAHPPDQAG